MVLLGFTHHSHSPGQLSLRDFALLRFTGHRSRIMDHARQAIIVFRCVIFRNMYVNFGPSFRTSRAGRHPLVK